MSKKQFYTLEKHQLKDRIKYNFCPFCWKDLKAGGILEDRILKDSSTLQTLWYLKLMVKEETDQGGEITYVEESYQCARCKRKDITVDDFEAAYCKPYQVVER